MVSNDSFSRQWSGDSHTRSRPIYPPTFGSLSLLLTVCSIPQAVPAAEQPDQSEQSPVAVQIELRDGSRLMGRLVRPDPIRFQNQFGPVELQPASIKEICFADQQREAATVTFRKGDLISGAVVKKVLRIKTDFGQVEVPQSKAARLLFNATSGPRVVVSDRSGDGCLPGLVLRTYPRHRIRSLVGGQVTAA